MPWTRDSKVLDTTWQAEHETFVPWYAKQRGWDKEAGYAFKLWMLDSGMARMEALPAGQWGGVGTGGVPMMFGALRHNAYLPGIGNDESKCDAVLVRPDNPSRPRGASAPTTPRSTAPPRP